MSDSKFYEYDHNFSDSIDDLFIKHFGIKGMKWGIRKERYRSGGILNRFIGNKKKQRGSRVQTITFRKEDFSSTPSPTPSYKSEKKSSRRTPNLIFDTSSYKSVENKRISNFMSSTSKTKDLWKQINLQNTHYKDNSVDDFTKDLLKKNAARLKAYGY